MTAIAPGLHDTRRRPPRPAQRVWRGFATALLGLVTLWSPADLHAGEPAVAIERPRQAQAPEPLCFCWNDGRKIAEGAAACIRTTQGRRLAQCGRVINMMSWQVTETPCPES